MTEWFDAGESSAIADPGSKGFELQAEAVNAAFFIVHKEGQLQAYRNSCPHTGAPLEWLPDQFLDLDNMFIQCAIHGALFRTEDGECLRGPCAGQSLQALPVKQEGGHIWVDVSSLRDAEPGAAASDAVSALQGDK